MVYNTDTMALLWDILSFTFGYVLEGMIETLRDSMFFLRKKVWIDSQGCLSTPQLIISLAFYKEL